jgi:hypothetical protein
MPSKIHDDIWRLMALEEQHEYNSEEPNDDSLAENILDYYYACIQSKYPELETVKIADHPSWKLALSRLQMPYETVQRYGMNTNCVAAEEVFAEGLRTELDHKFGNIKRDLDKLHPPHASEFYHRESPIITIERYLNGDDKNFPPEFYNLSYLKQKVKNLDFWVIQFEDYEVSVRLQRLHDLHESLLKEVSLLTNDKTKANRCAELLGWVERIKAHYTNLYTELNNCWDQNSWANVFANRCKKLSDIEITLINQHNIDRDDNVYPDSLWFPVQNLKPNLKLKQLGHIMNIDFRLQSGITLF